MTVITAQSPAEFEEILLDNNKLKDMFAEGVFGDFVKKYVNAVQAKDKDLGQQVKEQVETVLADMLKTDRKAANRLNLTPDSPQPAGRNRPNPRAIGAPLNGVFSDLGTMMACAWRHDRQKAQGDLAGAWGKLMAYQEAVPSEGGFLVPEEFRAELLKVSLETSVVRPRARVIPMGGPTLSFPAIDTTSNATSVFGGITVYRTEEGAELTESAASFGRIKLDATKQTALAHVDNALINDSGGAFPAFIDETFPPAMAFFEDVDFLKGNGAGAPLGALAAANGALIAVAKETGQAATTIVWQNVLRMYARMLPTSLANAVWIASPDTFFELATMALQVGTGGSAVWLVDGTGSPVLTLLGRPVILSEKAPAALGTQGDLSFVDFGYYLIGDRMRMTAMTSPHYKFGNDITSYRLIERLDGAPWIKSAITPKNGSASTLSPFVQIAANDRTPV
jgi:HK97 family phage major capsid protein